MTQDRNSLYRAKFWLICNGSLTLATTIILCAYYVAMGLQLGLAAACLLSWVSAGIATRRQPLRMALPSLVLSLSTYCLLAIGAYEHVYGKFTPVELVLAAVSFITALIAWNGSAAPRARQER